MTSTDRPVSYYGVPLSAYNSPPEATVTRTRDEDAPCSRGTADCCLDHVGDEECLPW
jgi:hypothetical protein